MKGRNGISLMAIAVIHAAFGFVFFHATLWQMVGEGLWNTVLRDPLRGTAAWYMLFSFPLFAMGQLIRAHERRREEVPGGAVLTLWLLVGVGVVLMPVSGFWLALPAAITLLRRPRLAQIRPITGG